MVIGAPGDGEGEVAASGAAHVFDAATGNRLGKLKPANPQGNDRFGAAVAASRGMVAVGAPQGGLGGVLAGSVSLYSRVADNLGALGTPVTGTNADDEFGAAVAVSGDHLVAGAPGDDADGANAGAAFLYALGASLGTPLRLGDADGGADNARFGAAVGISDGVVAVGAPGAVVNSMPSGAGYRFNVDGSQIEKIFARDGQLGLGSSIDLSADRLIIGAPQSDNAAGLATFQSDPEVLLGAGFE